MKITSPARPFLLLGFLVLSVSCQARPAAKDHEASSAPELSAQGGVVRFAKPNSAMAKAFKECHFQTILECMNEVMGNIRTQAAEAHPDRPPVVLSGNPAGGMHVPRWVELAAPFDYFNIECDVVSLNQKKALAHFLSIAALTESVDTTLIIMPNASSNKRWNRKENPIAYAQATGLSYAIGAHMHVPWCLYDGSQFNRFYGSLDGHQPIFRLIHDHADWFDGYVSALWHVLEVPYGDNGVGNLKKIESQILGYYEAGVPTVLRLTGEKSPTPTDRLSGEPHLRRTYNPSKPSPAPDSPFTMDADYQSAFLAPIPRVQHQASTTPLVMHLIRRFDAAASAPKSGRFIVAKEFIQDANVTQVEIAAPEWKDSKKPSVNWKMDSKGNLEISVENVPAWALLRLHTKAPVQLPGVKRSTLRQAMAESDIPLMRMIRFSDTWARPQWVDNAIASKTDPLDGYHITRISWSYDHSLQTLKYAQDKGLAFHGSDAFLHTYMALNGKPPQEGIATFTPDWPGWARYPDGHPMHIRPDFLPQRYGASFASPAYRSAMIERANDWINKGAVGVQFDDISGMVNRVWQYGGDFSDAFFTRFRADLVERGFGGVTADTPLEELRERVMAEVKYIPPHELRSDGTLAVLKPSSGYPGLVWAGTNTAFPIPDGPFSTEIEFRITKGTSKGVDLLLMDGDRSVYLVRVPLSDILPANAPLNEWMTLRAQYDLEAQTARFAVGKGGEWGKPKPFAMPLPAEATSLSPALMINPKSCSVELRKITEL